MSGRMVKTLVNGYVSGGTHEVTWNAADESGSILPSGMYLYRLQAGELTASGKMVYVK
jgi:flagellar hook assembly protein FlgD